MKIPKTFIPDDNLEDKMKDLLKSNKSIKKIEEQKDYKKRKIIIQSNKITDLLDNEIYILVKQPKGKKGYSLNIKSLYKFGHPISGSNTVPALLGSTKIKAYVRSQGMLHEYLNSLRYDNDGEIVWEGDKNIKKLRKYCEGWDAFTKLVMSDDENT